jgi:hypothetical protein
VDFHFFLFSFFFSFILTGIVRAQDHLGWPAADAYAFRSRTCIMIMNHVGLDGNEHCSIPRLTARLVVPCRRHTH